MKFSDFKVLTFDVVGTIIDFETGVLNSVRRLGGDAAARLSDKQIFDAFLRGRVPNVGRATEVMAGVYKHLAKELELPADDRTATQFQHDVLSWPAFADSISALKRLRKHFRLVAMTNTDRVAFSAYEYALKKPFDDSVTCDDAGTAKPDPRFFFFNLGRQSALGYKQSDILHVAQSQYHDIGIGKELGYTVCWIERRQGLEGFGATPVPERVTTPDFHFASLAQLADAVEAEGRNLS
ncbi:haloacid dehalogenase [Caballeronia hypogeia]|uniref:Haloacid dehalogenase n=1 Tax=Caballeronia hypogeia TaxID=1777140 RepID=A0A158CJD1_9BURK|nr:HAD-IA family hydrolase [Caballeronia hypogeia]SAK82435.1 haloacid dehalogenase [Caballeronia hypogeia]